jgi:hypothetical protein
MEGERGKWAWENERVMQLVDGAVQEVTVEGVVDPVDAKIGDHEKEEDGEDPIGKRQGEVVEVVKLLINLGVALFKGEMDGRINEGNYNNGNKGSPELTFDLSCTK